MQCFLHQGEALKAFNALCVGDGFSIEAQARVQATTKKNQLMEFPYFFLAPVSYWILFFLMKHEFSPDETLELSHIFFSEAKDVRNWICVFVKEMAA